MARQKPVAEKPPPLPSTSGESEGEILWHRVAMCQVGWGGSRRARNRVRGIGSGQNSTSANELFTRILHFIVKLGGSAPGLRATQKHGMSSPSVLSSS
jgi:hypothetical protein